jgi:DNA-binding transcriptional regulator YiaG
VRVSWDRAKNLANKKKHGVSFEEASELFRSGVDYLELFDDRHSDDEDRFIAIGRHQAWAGPRRLDGTGRGGCANHFRAVGNPNGASPLSFPLEKTDMTDIPELTAKQLARAISARVRKRLVQGRFESGDDIAALRRFVGLTQTQFARAMGISVHTLRNWEQGRRTPEGPALALLRIAARHPRILRENLRTAA